MSSMMRFAAAVAAVGTLGGSLGCTTLRGRADDAFRSGDPERAANLYEAALAKDPSDGEARQGLARSREVVLGDLLRRADKARAQGKTGEGLGLVEAALRKRRSWRFEPAAGQEAQLDALVKWARGAIEADVSRFLEAKAPLLAESALAVKEPLLAHSELGDARTTLEPTIRAAGQERCQTLLRATGEEKPYLRALVSKYCHHFAAGTPAAPPLPHTVGRLVVTGTVAGQSDGERAQLVAKLEEGLRRSPWFDERSPVAFAATLQGSQRVAFEKRAVALDKPWTERVPYTAYETVPVPYQEPYTFTTWESYSAPVTVFRTTSVPCGNRTCTQSMPSTEYRMQTRPVTRTHWRTAWRNETRAVTRYREYARTFVLHATEHAGAYDVDWTVHVDVGPGLSPMVLRRQAHDRQTGLEHDVTFLPAGVAPSRPNLRTAGVWFDEQLRELARTYAGAGNEHYRLMHCQAPRFDAESAARCVFAPTTRAPEAVKAALAGVFGVETEAVMGLGT